MAILSTAIRSMSLELGGIRLVRYFEPDQPVYGIQSQALLGERMALTRVEELAA